MFKHSCACLRPGRIIKQDVPARALLPGYPKAIARPRALCIDLLARFDNADPSQGDARRRTQQGNVFQAHSYLIETHAGTRDQAGFRSCTCFRASRQGVQL